MIRNPLRCFLRDKRGSVSILAAFFFIAMLSIGAFAVELSQLYTAKLREQRTSDLAALAATNTSSPIVSGAVSATAAATASNVAVINGFSAGNVTTSVSGGSNLQVVIASAYATSMAQIVSGSNSSTVTANTVVTPTSQSSAACVAATGTFLQLLTYSTLYSTGCGAAAQTYLQVSSANLNVTSAGVGYSQSQETSYVSSATSLNPALSGFQFSATITNSIASNASITAMASHLSAMSSWPYATTSPVLPSNPSVTTGTDWTSSTGTLTQSTRHGNLTVTNANLTFSGNGAADTNCATPTTISGNVSLSGTSTLTFDSGCYVIKGNVTLATPNQSTFAIASNATVNFVFEGNIINPSYGTMAFGNATYSFAGINNQQGGSITFGNGQMVFGGSVQNNYGFITFGNGPFYMTNTSISQNGGTIQFGNGPFYLFNGSIDNNTFGTMIFGNGPYYLYDVTMTNGPTSAQCPLMTFATGPYYVYAGSLNSLNCAATEFGPGNMDLYSSASINSSGNLMIVGNNGSSLTGSATLSLYGGSLNATSGANVFQGVTVASTTGAIQLGGSISGGAPTGSSPTYGYQNIAFYSQSGNITISPGSNTSYTGLFYAPNGSVSLSNSYTISVASGGCLEVVGSQVSLANSIYLNASPCTGLTVAASSAGVPKLGN